MAVLKYKEPGTGFWIDITGTSSPFTRSISVIGSSSAAGSAAKTDYIYICTAALTLTMPTAVGNTNRYSVKKAGSGDITIATTSSQTIDGSSTYTISVSNQTIDIVSDGSNWRVI